MDLKLFFFSRKHQTGWAKEGDNFNKDDILHFVKELNSSLRQQNRTLTSTFTSANTELVKSLNLNALSEYFDLMSFVPTYDYRAYSGNVTLDTLNATVFEQFLDNLNEVHVLPSKIVVGIQFLGHSFTHKPDGIQFGDTWGLSHACEMSRKLKVANLFIKKSSQQKTVTYYSLESEDAVSIRRKVEFVKSRNVAGVAAFPVNFDDFLEKCEEIDAKSAFSDRPCTFPFLLDIYKAISEIFANS